MAEWKPFLRRRLPQQISQHLTRNAPKKDPGLSTAPELSSGSGLLRKGSSSPLLVSLGLLASQVLTPALAEEEVHYEWRCRPAVDSQDWDCREVAVPGPAYERPRHSRLYHRQTTAEAARSTSRPAPLRQNLDWVEEAQLTPEQRQSMPPGCCGAYIEPERTDAEANLSPSQASLRATADKSELQRETTAVLQGDVRLTQGYRQIAMDKATLDKTTNIATLEGDIQLREPGLLLTATGATLNTETGEAQMSNTQYVMHATRVRGTAEQLQRRSDEVLVMTNGSFTQCEPDSEAWALRGSEIKIDPATQQGSGKHVRLNVGGVPVFYTPYLRFPAGNQRQSGFLFPSLGSSDDGGADASIPYYFNLAPNYDLILSPRYISDRGEMLETQFRHLSKLFYTDINAAFLSSDDGGDDEDKEKQLQELLDAGQITQAEFDTQLKPFEGEDRWLINVNQRGGLSQRWSSSIDYTKVSDIDYFRDLDTASLDVNSTTHLKKFGSASYRSEHWQYSIALEEFQTIVLNVDDPYKQLPRVNVDGSYQWGDWQLELDNEIVRFDHRDDFHDENPSDPRILGERARIEYSLSWNKQWIWGFFKPNAMVKSIAYELDEDDLRDDADHNPSIVVPQGSLDAGLFFEREGNLFGSDYLQTFEPRLFYFYSDFESHEDLFNLTDSGRDIDFDTAELTFSYESLFRDTRFSGGDRIDDANQVSVGLTTRFISDSGIERLRASLGQIFYFDNRRVTLTDSFSADEINNPDALLNDLKTQLADENLSISAAAAKRFADLTELTEDQSELAAQLAGQLRDHWRYSLDVAWNDRSGKVSRGSAYLRYIDDKYRIVNLGYRYNRKDPRLIDSNEDLVISEDEVIEQTIDQGDISFIWPVFGGWSLIARGNHDFTNDRELETFAGLEYNDCCYRVRLLARRWLDNELINTIEDLDLEYDKGVFFEFELKGLGGIGSKVSGVLEDSIVNYSRRAENLR